MLTAWTFRRSIILAYIRAVFISDSPSNFDVVERSTPSVSIIVANVFLAVLKVIRLLIPAALPQALTSRLTITGEGKSKT